MGTQRLGPLPRTRKWAQVVELIEDGAGTAEVAAATADLGEKAVEVAHRPAFVTSERGCASTKVSTGARARR